MKNSPNKTNVIVAAMPVASRCGNEVVLSVNNITGIIITANRKYIPLAVVLNQKLLFMVESLVLALVGGLLVWCLMELFNLPRKRDKDWFTMFCRPIMSERRADANALVVLSADGSLRIALSFCTCSIFLSAVNECEKPSMLSTNKIARMIKRTTAALEESRRFSSNKKSEKWSR